MKKKLVLALGGGGARAFAHIGVYKILKENGFKISGVAGTSMGALIGALIADGKEPEEIYNLFKKYIEEKDPLISGIPRLIKYKAKTPFDIFKRNIKQRLILNLGVNIIGLFSSQKIIQFLKKFLEDKKIEDLKIPFCCTATDLLSGEIYRFFKGDLRTAVLSSLTLPGFFKPFPYEGKILVDGGVIEEIPVESAKILGEPVLAIDVSHELPEMTGKENMIDLIYRLFYITLKALRKKTIENLKYYICVDIKDCQWYEFENFDFLVKAGELSAIKFLNEKF